MASARFLVDLDQRRRTQLSVGTGSFATFGTEADHFALPGMADFLSDRHVSKVSSAGIGGRRRMRCRMIPFSGKGSRYASQTISFGLSRRAIVF